METKSHKNKSKKQNENRLRNSEKKAAVDRGDSIWGRGMKQVMSMKKNKLPGIK